VPSGRKNKIGKNQEAQPISMFTAQVPPRKFLNSETVLQYLAGRDFLRGKFFPGTSFRPWFLRCKHTEYHPKVPSSWSGLIIVSVGFRRRGLWDVLLERKVSGSMRDVTG